MKKIEIDGRKFNLKTRKEVTYGAHKEVNDLKIEAQLAVMSNKDVAEMWVQRTKGSEEGANAEEITGETLLENVAKGDIKKAIIDSSRAALPVEVEAIMLSASLTRDEVFNLPKDVVDELSKAANDALGGLLNFTKPSTTDTT